MNTLIDTSNAPRSEPIGFIGLGARRRAHGAPPGRPRLSAGGLRFECHDGAVGVRLWRIFLWLKPLARVLAWRIQAFKKKLFNLKIRLDRIDRPATKWSLFLINNKV
ncbi:hypothetical protein LP414_08045 [Polaromonas sp. P1(28)-13]|nr:hypothetical protein LP414_08045 [Polaromonas sp. P1(28)-13]